MEAYFVRQFVCDRMKINVFVCIYKKNGMGRVEGEIKINVYETDLHAGFL